MLWYYWAPLAALQLAVVLRSSVSALTRHSSRNEFTCRKPFSLLAWALTALALSATLLHVGFWMLRAGPATERLAALALLTRNQQKDFKWLARIPVRQPQQ
jgi:hypothetical protein